MNDNMGSGGLICKAGNRLVISDIHHYESTLMMNTDTDECVVLDGVFWFMNVNGDSIFYSDHKQGNALFRLNMLTHGREQLLNRPCYGLIHSGDWLYYRNEMDNKLYRCLLNGGSESRLTDDQVAEFVLDEDRIYFTTQYGIRACGLDGGQRKSVADLAAARLVKVGDWMAFADKNNEYRLTLLNVRTNETMHISDIVPESLNTDGRYLYGTNRLHNQSIYRIDPEQGHHYRICGDRAQHLHIIDQEIYYDDQHEWSRMSLLGGKAQKVTNRIARNNV